MSGIIKINELQVSNTTVIDSNKKLSNVDIVPNSSFMFRNKIINGDMRIDQRNGGSAISTHSNFVVDRFYCALQGGSASGITVQQSSDVPSSSTFKNSIVYTTGTAGSVGSTGTYGVQQRIEGYKFSDFLYGSSNVKTFTLSFWVKSSVTGNYGIGLRNSAKDRSYIATYEIRLPNTWEYKTITVSGDTSGTWLSDTGIGLDIFFSLGVGTNYQTTANSWQSGNLFGLTDGAKPVETTGSTFYITGVQLEIGTVATPFEHRPIGVEKSLCYRYYYRMTANPVSVTVGGTTTTNAAYIGFAVGRAYSTTAGTAIIFLPEPLRTSPPVFNYSPISGSNWDYGISAMSLVNRQLVDTRTIAIYASITVAQSQSSWLLSTGNIGNGSSSTDSVFMDFSAEL